MSDTETVNTQLNPSRQAVRNLVSEALDSSEGDPAQTFADMIMATAQVAYMGNLNLDDMDLNAFFKTAEPNAKIACDWVMSQLIGMEEQS